MPEKMASILRIVLTAVVGYAAIAVGTTLTFEVWLGGIGFYKSSFVVLALASLGAMASGAVGGYLAAWVGGRQPLRHALAVLVFLIIDTTYVVTSGISDDPLWFDLAASTTLIAATVGGGFMRQMVQQGKSLTPQAAA